MEYILSTIVIILTFYGCYWSHKNKPRNKPRNTAKEVEEMLKGREDYYKKYRKEISK